MTISVKGNMKAILKHHDKAARKHIPAAAARAINRTASWTRTQIKREGAQMLRVPVGVLNKRMKINRATRRDPSALIRLLTGGISAAKLKPRETRRGVRAGRHSFDGAFVERGIGNRLVVFQRKGAARLPLEGKKIPVDRVVQWLTFMVQRESRIKFNAYFARDLQARLDGHVAR